MKYAQLVKTSLFAVGVASASIMAATQGTLGSSSTGSVDISVAIEDRIMVSNLNDISFGSYLGTGELTLSENFCLFQNGSGYNVTMSGDGLNNAFTLSDGGANSIPYTVQYSNGDSSTMTSLVTLSGQSLFETTNADCTMTGDNASVSITLSSGSLGVAPVGNYVGTLTMIFAPE